MFNLVLRRVWVPGKAGRHAATAVFHGVSAVGAVYVLWDVYGVYGRGGGKSLSRHDFVFSLPAAHVVSPWGGWGGMWPSIAVWTLYSFNLGWYVHDCFDLIDRRPPDAGVLFAHHGATLLLLVSSWCYNAWLYGIIVLSLHDLGDPLLELLLALRAWPSVFSRVSIPLFLLFALVWVVTRLIMFPLFLFGGLLYAWHDSCLFELVSPYDTDVWNVLRLHTSGSVCAFVSYIFVLLLTICVCNFVWTYFIMLVAVSTLRTNHVRDSRKKKHK